MQIVKPGLEQLAAAPPPYLKNKRIGLLCNAASVDNKLIHAREHLFKLFNRNLKAIFSPQHGFYAEKQDNMIESSDRLDPWLNIPIYSLYSATRAPSQKMLAGLDVLVIDLQDVGTRVYTFMYTMSYCLEAAKKYGLKVIVLDRPNPIGGVVVEGNCLNPRWSSFVGRYPIPMRHGLTMGELALLFNEAYCIGCDLEVIPMSGWNRQMLFPQTRMPWIPPSPNLPTPVSVQVYPGQVIWEGTNVSEARGTTQPFEIFGAPFFNQQAILEFITTDITGVILRPVEFEPTSNKWARTLCRGFQIHITHSENYAPYRTSLLLLQAVLKCHKSDFKWKAPPYEYEYHRNPIDLILGGQWVRESLENMTPIDAMEQIWNSDLMAFDQLRKKYFLYS
ncbi:MAG: DUF1343 domain-containing protein [Desulfobacteraceae bacterium]|nr:DUF1343 domain-containing protein [Desulfobacteraceae bacterium]